MSSHHFHMRDLRPIGGEVDLADEANRPEALRPV